MLDLIHDINDAAQDGLLNDFLNTTKGFTPDFVRGDKLLAIFVRPVKTSITNERPWDDDFASGDIHRVAIGNPDERPDSGDWPLSIDGNDTGMTALSFDVTAAALQTVLSAASVTEGYGACAVTLLSEATYQVRWATDGEVPVLVSSADNLFPTCQINISRLVPGSASTRALQIISLRQSPVAYSEPATPQGAADVTSAIEQAATVSQNKIVRISFDVDGTYAGTYSITVSAGGVTAACGFAGPLISADELGLILANHPSIFFQDPTQAANVIVTKTGNDFLVEFVGTLAGSTLSKTITTSSIANPSVITTSASHGFLTGDSVTIAGHSGSTPDINGTHAITIINSTTFSIPVNVTTGGTGGTVFNNSQPSLSVSNVDLLAPKGLSGVLNLNTLNLYRKFYETEANELTFQFSIEIEKPSGEVRTTLLVPVTLRRDIIDFTTIVPVELPTAKDTLKNTFINNGTDYGITDLTGGDATDLDSIVTVNAIVGRLIFIADHGLYELQTGTDAEASPGIIRPDDYATTTNEKIWVQLL